MLIAAGATDHCANAHALAACGGLENPSVAPPAGLEQWRSVRVEHCSDAHGLVLRAAAGWSLVYSGDTRPCARLAAAGAGATLLVHEATFEPGLLAQARAAPHRTSGCTFQPPPTSVCGGRLL